MINKHCYAILYGVLLLVNISCASNEYSEEACDDTELEELKSDVKDIKATIEQVPVRFFVFLGQLVHYLTLLGVGMQEDQQQDVVEILEGTSEDIGEVLEEVAYACEVLVQLAKILMIATVVFIGILLVLLATSIHNAYYLRRLQPLTN